MNKKTWQSNAYWLDDKAKDSIRAILTFEDDRGRKVKQELTINKTNPTTKEANPDFVELVETVGEDTITQNTVKRKEQKQKEAETRDKRRKAEKQRKELAELFNAKIEIMEVEEIKNSDDRELKSKIRRAKSRLEMEMYAILLMMKETQNNANSE